MSSTQAVFMRNDGVAELREVMLDDRGRPPQRVMLSRRSQQDALAYSAWAGAPKTPPSGYVDAADFRLTDEGVDYPIYREVTTP